MNNSQLSRDAEGYINLGGSNGSNPLSSKLNIGSGSSFHPKAKKPGQNARNATPSQQAGNNEPCEYQEIIEEYDQSQFLNQQQLAQQSQQSHLLKNSSEPRLDRGNGHENQAATDGAGNAINFNVFEGILQGDNNNTSNNMSNVCDPPIRGMATDTNLTKSCDQLMANEGRNPSSAGQSRGRSPSHLNTDRIYTTK